jgi:pimeloyl-ACP methyl ester carboxylesterase
MSARANYLPLGCALVALLFAGAAEAARAKNEVAVETLMIPAQDAGITLHLRNKHVAGARRFASERILLMVHGATFSSETAFDIDLPGGSWMDYAARRGFDVYSLDIRGYGRSTRPPAMNVAPEANPPFADHTEAERDIAAAVDYILDRRDARQLTLLGWSWGTTTTAGFAAAHPDKVGKLVLFAPVWVNASKPNYSGAYRLTTREAARGFIATGVPGERANDVLPPAWFEQWWTAVLATDLEGAARNPPVLRAPNGALKDLQEIWGAGRPSYDPAAIRAPTLLVVGEWDGVTPPAYAQELFKQLTHARHRRLVLLSEGSHFMAIEKHRLQLVREVQGFIEQPAD